MAWKVIHYFVVAKFSPLGGKTVTPNGKGIRKEKEVHDTKVSSPPDNSPFSGA